MKLYVLLFAGMLLSPAVVNAQDQGHLPCAVDDLTKIKPLDQFTPQELAAMQAAEAELDAFTHDFAEGWSEGSRVDYVIPVVFHIIHNNGPENISDEQIFDAMRVLNEDFNKQNPDWDNVRPEFLDIVADVGIEFRLAQKDPNGNCTKGITRTVSALTNDGTQTMKNLIQWPRNRYLNVWVAASANGAAGYTYRPSAVNGNPSWDGIVLLHTYTGSIGTSSPSRSRTLTHEVGHWINLKHTWGGTNEPELPSNCDDDDDVTDTPNTIGWTTCFLSGATCGSLDNVENYMDYSYCSKMFTNGQGTRMVAALNSGTAQRNQLWTESNLTFTGVNEEPELCAAEFTTSTLATCAGATVNFADVSYHGVVSRTWNFPGGTPETSSDETPTVTYSTSGVFPVTLTVSDGATTLTSTQPTTITVLPNPGVPMPFDEGFEAYENISTSPWTVSNPNGNNTWAITEATAHTGTKSIRLLNSSSMAEQLDDLISNTLDMSNESSIRISYRYAFARRTSTNDDRLRVYVSNDCGQTWSMRQQLRGSNILHTADGNVTGSFVPTASEWAYTEIANIGETYYTSNFRFKFEFLSDGGNNVYLDDININGSPVGIDDLATSENGLVVVPNPAEDAAQVVFNLTESGPLRLELMDVLGRQIQVLHDGVRGAGTHRIDLPVAGLQSGIYFVRLQQGGRQLVVRFVVK